MAEKLLMLALSPTMETGVITRWLKKEGDTVESGDVLCEVETDKATMDYESPASGVLLKIVKGEGSNASIGDLIGIIGKAGEDISALLGGSGAAAPAQAAPAEAPPAQAAPSAPVEPIAPAEPQAPPTQSAPSEPQAMPNQAAPAETQAPAAPTTQSAAAEPAAQALPATQAEGNAAAEPSAQTESPAAQGQSGFIRATPLARKIAETNGLPLERIAGSGPEGRIIKADVEKAMAAPAAPAAPAQQPSAPGQAAAQPAPELQTAATAPQAPAQPVAAVPMAPGDVNIPISGKRRIIAQRLSESMFTAPHYYLKVRVEMDGIMAARSRLNEGAETKVSVNAVLIKFAAEALKRHPQINSTWAVDNIIQHGRIDVGLAVAQKDGLITPVVRDCGSKGLLQIETELKELIQKARSNTLKPDEYTGATFTISSLGSFGIEEFTAIINPPGSAILAVGEIRKEAVVQLDETLEVRSIMRLTLSCDHRVIDGAVGAAFLSDLRSMLEEPVRALY